MPMNPASQAVYFITHPDVRVDPSVPVPDWSLSVRGRERMQSALGLPWVADLGAIHSSTERKAVEGAEILAGHLGLDFARHADLGENDRTSTGFLPPSEFEAVADLFFAHPLESVRGWETAAAAQERICAAVDRILTQTKAGCPVAIVSHGAVGALLLCRLLGEPIDRKRDQPPTGGGNFYVFDAATRAVQSGWTTF